MENLNKSYDGFKQYISKFKSAIGDDKAMAKMLVEVFEKLPEAIEYLDSQLGDEGGQFYEMDPKIIAIWKKFGKSELDFIQLDDSRFFGKKLDSFEYYSERDMDDVISTRVVRTIVMDIYRLDPHIVHHLMNIWRKGIADHITDVSMSAFLDSQQVIDMFGRGILTFYGVSISGTIPDYEIKKIELDDRTMKEAWQFFTHDDKLLIIQDSDPYIIPKRRYKNYKEYISNLPELK